MAKQKGGTLIGYQRVSTDDQNLDMQRKALREAGVHPRRIYEDKVFGARSDRPGLNQARKTMFEFALMHIAIHSLGERVVTPVSHRKSRPQQGPSTHAPCKHRHSRLDSAATKGSRSCHAPPRCRHAGRHRVAP